MGAQGQKATFRNARRMSASPKGRTLRILSIRVWRAASGERKLLHGAIPHEEAAPFAAHGVAAPDLTVLAWRGLVERHQLLEAGEPDAVGADLNLGGVEHFAVGGAAAVDPVLALVGAFGNPVRPALGVVRQGQSGHTQA